MRLLLYSALAAFVLLALVVFFLPIAFTACSKESIWCTISWWLTQSGGKAGTVIMLVGIAIVYTFRTSGFNQRLLTFMKTVFVLGALIGIIAFINEHFTKELIKQPRPSHIYILGKNPLVTLDSIYAADTKQRKKLLNDLISGDTIRFKSYDSRVLAHWIEESGFSFPSGHSFNVFLLAMVLSFTMIHSRIKFMRWIYWLPFVWATGVAVSRVAIGAHSEYDVTAGAGAGILLGALFLYFDVTRKWITHRDDILPQENHKV